MHHPFPQLSPGQVAVTYAEVATGITLSLDGGWNTDPASSPYHIFSAEHEAIQAAEAFVHRYPKAEALICDHTEKVLHRFQKS
jgi:hypothetical protein